MSYRFRSFHFCFLIVLFYLITPTICFGYGSGRGKWYRPNTIFNEKYDKKDWWEYSTHPLITAVAITRIKIEYRDEVEKYLDEILKGCIEEDSPIWKTYNHFYNPETGQGLNGKYKSALEWANDETNEYSRFGCSGKYESLYVLSLWNYSSPFWGGRR